MTLRPSILFLSATLSLAAACKDTGGAGAGAPGSASQPVAGDEPVAGAEPAAGAEPTDKPADTPAMPVILPPEPKPGQGPAPTSDSAFVQCTEPRPGGVCTREYRPVCGKKADGSRQTFANKCNACSDLAITGYNTGSCESGGGPQ